MPTDRRQSEKYRKLFEYLARRPGGPSLSFRCRGSRRAAAAPSSRRQLPHRYCYEGSAVARDPRAGCKARAVDLEVETLELWPEDLLPDQGRDPMSNPVHRLGVPGSRR